MKIENGKVIIETESKEKRLYLTAANGQTKIERSLIARDKGPEIKLSMS